MKQTDNPAKTVPRHSKSVMRLIGFTVLKRGEAIYLRAHFRLGVVFEPNMFWDGSFCANCLN